MPQERKPCSTLKSCVGERSARETHATHTPTTPSPARWAVALSVNSRLPPGPVRRLERAVAAGHARRGLGLGGRTLPSCLAVWGLETETVDLPSAGGAHLARGDIAAPHLQNILRSAESCARNYPVAPSCLLVLSHIATRSLLCSFPTHSTLDPRPPTRHAPAPAHALFRSIPPSLTRPQNPSELAQRTRKRHRRRGRPSPSFPLPAACLFSLRGPRTLAPVLDELCSDPGAVCLKAIGSRAVNRV